MTDSNAVRQAGSRIVPRAGQALKGVTSGTPLPGKHILAVIPVRIMTGDADQFTFHAVARLERQLLSRHDADGMPMFGHPILVAGEAHLYALLLQ
jgi:hypothetical protein